VLSGTTTELNLESQFSARGLAYDALTFEDNDTLREAFIAERCDGWTSDLSQLAAIRSAWPDGEGGPEALQVLGDTLSKEPLGPAVRDGDSRWFDAVNWADARHHPGGGVRPDQQQRAEPRGLGRRGCRARGRPLPRRD
jgi:general L-amino acid transport system substrate-binding protein